MKKWIICLALLLTALLLTACGDEPDTTSPAAPTAAPIPTEPPAQLHTLPPTQAQPETEWVSIDAVMSLEDDDNVYAKGSDFLSFAIVGSGDHAELHFKLDDMTAQMLRTQSAANVYYVSMNGVKLGGVTLNKNCDELTLQGDHTYDELCLLANRIRGFE